MRAGIACLVIACALGSLSPGASSREARDGAERPDISFEDRVAAQRAIEQVYWNQRIWPKENPGPKPPLSAVLPDAELRARVANYLRESNALDRLWHRPLSAGQLQAELDRMMKSTRDPGTLRQLFAALGDDPALIAETLARQTLADRLVRGWYAADDRIHGELRARAEAALASCATVACMASMGGRYSETRWQLAEGFAGAAGKASEAIEVAAGGTAGSRSGDRPQDGAVALRGGAVQDNHRHTVRLEPQDWKSLLGRVSRIADAGSGATSRTAASDLPEGRRAGSPHGLGDDPGVGSLGRLEETADGFSVTAILEQSGDSLTTASVVWDKQPFDEWWRSVGPELGTTVEPPRGAYSIDSTLTDGCTVDTWSSLPGAARRSGHSAVWTGSEMIVWGGGGIEEPVDSGLRYTPATDTWTATSRSLSSPSARSGCTAVWTGTEMIVWGGASGSISLPFNDGGRYDPTTDSWTPLTGGPATVGHTAVWTGTRMIIWGGYISGGVKTNTGRLYDPSTDAWQPTSTAGAPEARDSHAAVWTGSEMIVWGGSNASYQTVNSGGRYDPSANSWRATSVSATTPAGAYGRTAVWTGTRMIVWGGQLYTPSSMVLNTGGRYDPAADSWEATSITANTPSARVGHSAVWSGTEMIVWGGGGDAGLSDTGGRYNPGSDSWVRVTSRPNTPIARSYHTAVWTGTEMIVWGGRVVVGTSPEVGDVLGPVDSGGRYSPTTDSWVATSIPSSHQPTERMSHTAVWTGSEMIVWGGQSSSSALRSGGRYRPATDSWEPTSTGGGGVPSARWFHTAVWTGTEMIVWGGTADNGNGGVALLDSGGRYNPLNDSWQTTARNGACPSPRTGHTAVWTGTQMIVWGGDDWTLGLANTGGRYTPGSNSWTATPTEGAPTGRTGATAVWTGSEMIVWGGRTGAAWAENTGGRYNPSTNSWQATSLGAGVPAARTSHTAVWTGTQMVVWGGQSGNYLGFNTGGRYDPATDSWEATSVTASTPSGRVGHSAVWSGTEMILWGGTETVILPGGGTGQRLVNTGGRYNPWTDAWLPTSTSGHVPYPRDNQTAVWTGSQMIVWGGWAGTSEVSLRVLGSGGAYCADHCASPATLHQDADGDGYGDPGVSRVTCASPAGWVANAGDCNDAYSSVYPGAPEVCNGVDDDCDTAIDDGIPVPSGSPTLTEWRGAGTSAGLSWTPIPGATGYDVVIGDLGLLHASMGDFASSTTGCLENSDTDLYAEDPGVVPPGSGSWHVVRAVNACAGNGSYDDGTQQGSRDAEIAASAQPCP